MAIIRVVHFGTIGGVQGWSVGHTMSVSASDFTDAQFVTFADGLQSAFKVQLWVGSSAGYLAGVNTTGTRYEGCKVYLKASSSAPATRVALSTGAAVAGSQTNGTAAQLALVATLEDGIAGRAHKGRMYLPLTAGPVSGTTLIFDPTFVTQTAIRTANYLGVARVTSLGGPTVDNIVSSVTAATPIRRVSVDGVVDTQRRRRDKLRAPRATAAVPVG